VANVPTLRFPGFTEEWQKSALGDICTVQMCKRIFAHQTSEVGDVPFYKIGTIGDIPDSYISKELFDEYRCKYNYPKQGEVMITCAGTVGKAIPFDGADSYFQDSNIVWLSNPNDKINNKFLYYIISQVDWSRLNSTTITRIYNDDLRKLGISYPNRTEQKKIADFLSLLDKRITLQSKLIDHLKSLMDGIVVKHWGGVEKKKYSLTELGEAFSVMNLSKEDLTEDGKRCIIYGELFTTYDAIIDNVVSHTDKVDRLTLSEDNDLLFPASTTVDAYSLIAPSAITERGIVLGGDMFGIHISQEHSAEYISLIINAIYRNKLSKYAKGSTIIHLHYGDIKNVEVELPDLKTQLYLVGVVKRLRTKFSIETDYLVKLNKAKQSLLSALFI